MPTFTFNCPECAKKISADEQWRGQSLSCPWCNKPVMVPEVSHPSKIRCPYCSAKLEIQDNWLGAAINCPRCQKEIELDKTMLITEGEGPSAPRAAAASSQPPPQTCSPQISIQEMPQLANGCLLGGYDSLEKIFYDRLSTGWYEDLFPKLLRVFPTLGIIFSLCFCLLGSIIIILSRDYALDGTYSIILSTLGAERGADKIFSAFLFIISTLASCYINIKLIRISDFLISSSKGEMAPGILRIIPVLFIFILSALIIGLRFINLPFFDYLFYFLLILLPMALIAPIPGIVNVEITERSIGEVFLDIYSFFLRALLKFLPVIWVILIFLSLFSFGIQVNKIPLAYFILFSPLALAGVVAIDFLWIEILKAFLSIPKALGASHSVPNNKNVQPKES